MDNLEFVGIDTVRQLSISNRVHHAAVILEIAITPESLEELKKRCDSEVANVSIEKYSAYMVIEDTGRNGYDVWADLMDAYDHCIKINFSDDEIRLLIKKANKFSKELTSASLAETFELLSYD